MSRRWSRPVGRIGVILYVVACVVPAVYIDDGRATSHMSLAVGAPAVGLMVLIYGLSINPVAWAANPVWLFGLIGLFRGKHVIARNCGVAASVLGLANFVSFSSWSGRPVTGSSGDGFFYLASFVVWLCGIIGLLRGEDRFARNCGYAASGLYLAILVELMPRFGTSMRPLVGYYFWQASLVCLAVAGLLGASAAKPQAKSKGVDDLA